jgi:SAM-dependent methyltransferase
VVLATETLEHVERYTSFLQEAKRVLRGNGLLIITVPFAASWHFVPYDYWRITRGGLQVALKAAGFNTASVYACGNDVTVACYKVMALILLLLGKFKSRWMFFPARLLGTCLAPAMFPLAILGHLSLRSKGGCHTLGYTVIARYTSDADQYPISTTARNHG